MALISFEEFKKRRTAGESADDIFGSSTRSTAAPKQQKSTLPSFEEYTKLRQSGKSADEIFGSLPNAVQWRGRSESNNATTPNRSAVPQNVTARDAEDRVKLLRQKMESLWGEGSKDNAATTQNQPGNAVGSARQADAERQSKEYSSVAQIDYDYDQRIQAAQALKRVSRDQATNPAANIAALINGDARKNLDFWINQFDQTEAEIKNASAERESDKNSYLYNQFLELEGKDWQEKYATAQAQFDEAKSKYHAADDAFKNIAGYITNDMAAEYAKPIEDEKNATKFDMDEKLALLDFAKKAASWQSRQEDLASAKAAGMSPLEWYGSKITAAQEKADAADQAYYDARNAHMDVQTERAGFLNSDRSGVSQEEQDAILAEIDNREMAARERANEARVAYDQAMQELANAKNDYYVAGKEYGENAALGKSNFSVEGAAPKADKRASTLYYGKYADVLDRPDFEEKSQAMGKAPNSTYALINGQREMNLADAPKLMYSYMTDDEVGVYNYLYATEGKKSANEFLKSITPELNMQHMSGLERNMADKAGEDDLSKVLYSVGSVAIAPVRGLAGAAASVEDLGKVLNGDKYDIDPNSYLRSASLLTQAAREGVSEDFTSTGKFVYDTAMSAGDSAVNMAVTAGVGSALGLSGEALMAFTNKVGAGLMSSEVMSMSVAEAKNKGYSDMGAFTLGVTRGGIEYMTEKIGGEWVIKNVKANPTNFLNVLVRSSIPEGIEEVMGDVGNESVNLLADNIFGTEESYIRNAYREFEARGSANPLADTLGVIILQEAQSFAGGALATIGNTSVQYSTMNASVQKNANILNTTPEEIVNLMNEMDIENPEVIGYLAELNDVTDVSAFRKVIETYEDAAAAIDEAMKITGMTDMGRGQLMREAGIGSVANQTGAAWDVLTGKVTPEESQAKAREAEGKLGITRARNRITIADQAAAYGGAQEKLKAAGVENDTLATAIAKVALNEKAKRTDAAGNIEPTKYQQRLVDESELAQRIVRELEAEAVMEETTSKVTEKDFNPNVQVNGTAAKIVGVKDGKVQVQQNGQTKTVEVKELEGISDSYRKLVNIASSMEGGTEMLEAYRPGQNITAYSIAWNRAYSLYGAQTDWSVEKIRQVGRNALAALSDAQLEKAVTLGRQNADTNTKEKAQRGKLTHKVEFYKGGTIEGTEYDGVTEEEARKLLGDGEMEILNALTNVANVTLIKSKADANGNYIGAQGIFFRNGRLYLDVNAGLKGINDTTGKRTVVLTAAHELTHFIRAYNEAGYKALRAFITNELANKGMSIDRLIDQKQARSAVKLSYDEALEEVIADSCETMLLDSNALARFASQYEAEARTIHNWLDKFLTKIENALKRLKGEHPEAIAMQDKIGELRDMWYKALNEAVATASVEEISSPEEAVIEQRTESGFTASIEEGNTSMNSLRTFDEAGRANLEAFLNKQVQSNTLTAEQARQMREQIEQIYDVCKGYDNGEYEPFSAWSNAKVISIDGRPVFSVVKQNGEYKLNLDFSLVCKKRRTLDAVFNEMIRRGIMNDFRMGQGSIARINQIIRDHGFEVACGLCFVDSKRYRQGMIADAFCKMYNMQVFSLMKGTGAKVDSFNFGGDATIINTGEGIDTLPDSKLNWEKVDEILRTEKKGTVKYKIADHLKNNPQDRKLVSRGDFMSTAGFDQLKIRNPELLSIYNSKKGAGGPKAAQSDVQYLNEIIQQGQFNEADAYAVGGVRIQSFSDYVGRLVFDYVQMVADLSAKKLPAHSYTKEFMFAQQFGLTGIKINMSLVPEVVQGVDKDHAGLDKDGNYAWKDGQSFGSTVYDNNGKRLTAAEGFELAKKIQNAEGYSKNCGTIAVGVSRAHIEKMLDDPEIRMIIPYHKSGLNHLVAAMNQIDKYTDYTNVQNTREYKNGKWSRIPAAKEFNWNETLQRMQAEGKGAREAAKAYLDWCTENGYKAKFDEFAGHPNYYKLLEDFSCYDKDGTTSTPLGAVQMNFPTESDAFGSMKDLIKAGLEEDAMLQAKQEGGVNDIVDEIESTLPEWEAEHPEGKKNAAKLSAREQEAIEVEESDVNTKYSLREEAPPKKTMIGYKVFMASKKNPGQLYPTKVKNPGGQGTPVGVWLNADTGELARNPDGSLKTNTKGRLAVEANGGTLAWRPGWHLGSLPEANQMNRADPNNPESNNSNRGTTGLMWDNYIFCECEFAADEDYQLEAFEYGTDEKGKYNHTQAGLPYIPKDGYYKYRTNPDPSTAPWFISGAIKITKILDDNMRREIISKWNAEHPNEQMRFTERYSGKDINLEEYGLKAGPVTPSADLSYLAPGVDYSDEIRNLPGYTRHALNFNDPKVQEAFRIQQIEDRKGEYIERYNQTHKAELEGKLDDRENGVEYAEVKFSSREDYKKTAKGMETISDEQYLKDLEERPFIKIMDYTPEYVLQNGKEKVNHPVIIKRSVLYLEVRTNGVQDGTYHGLGGDFMALLPDKIEDPDVLLEDKFGKRKILTSFPAKTGEHLISIEFHTLKDFEGKNDYYNIVLTAMDFDRRYLGQLFRNQGAKIVAKKEDLAQLNPKLHTWLETINAISSNGSILPGFEYVNPEDSAKKSDRDTFKSKAEIDAEIERVQDQIRDIQNAQWNALEAAKKDPRVQEAQKKMWAAEDKNGYSSAARERMEYRRTLKQVKEEMNAQIPEGDLNELADRVKDLKELREQFLKVTPITAAQYDKLAKHFGTTKDYSAAGFILKDGRMLDFSGKKQYGKAYAGGREVYHNEVGDVLNLPTDTSPRIDMVSNGNIRLVPEINGINLSQKPTAQQKDALRGFIEFNNGSVHVDIDNAAGRTIDSFGYFKNTSASKILADIDRYFETGETPTPQSEMRAYLSLRDTEAVRRQQAKDRARLDALRAEKNAKIESVRREEIEKRRAAIKKEKAAKWAKVEETEQKYRDMMKRQQTRRSDSAMRKKIRKVIDSLNSRLAHPTDKKYVPRELVSQTIDLLNMIDMDTGRGSVNVAEKLAKIRAMYERYKADEKYSAIYDESVSEALDNLALELGDTKLVDMDSHQLDRVLAAVKMMDHMIHEAVNVKIAGEERDAFEVAREMMTETKQNAREKDGFLHKWYTLAHLRADVVFKRFAGHKLHSTWEKVARMLDDGQLKQTAIKLQLSAPFAKLINNTKNMLEFQGLNALGRVQDSKLIDIGLKDADGNAIKVTHDIAVGIYMDLLNADNRRHFINGGKTIPNLQKFYNGDFSDAFGIGSRRAVGISQQLSDLNHEMAEAKRDGGDVEEIQARIEDLMSDGESYAEEVKRSIEDQMTDFDREWIDTMQQLFDVESKKLLNETTMEVYGIEKAQVDNYFPISSDPAYLTQAFEEVTKDMNLENVGFMKERVKSGKPTLAMGSYSVANRQIDKVAQYCGLMPAIRNFNKIWNKQAYGYSDSLKEEVRSKFGQKGLDWMGELIADLTGSRKNKDSFGFGAALSWMRGNLAQTSLTLNFRVALSQAASYPTAAAELDAKSLAKAFRHGRITEADKTLIAKWSPLLAYRMQGYSTVELGDIKNSNRLSSRVWKKMRWATGWIQAVDGATVARLWYASEYWVQDHKAGLEVGSDAYYEAVAEKFNDVVEKTQPNYTPMQRATILRSPSDLTKTLTMFMTQRLQNANILYDSAKTYNKAAQDFDAKRNNVTAADVQEAKSGLVRAVTSQIAQTLTFTMFRLAATALLRGMKKYRDDDDELTAESIGLGLLDDFASALFGTVILGSEMYDAVMAALGKKKWYGVSVNGVESISDLIESLTNLAQADWSSNDGRKKAKKKLMNVATSLCQFLGIPLSNAVKIGDAMNDWATDFANGRPFSFEAGTDWLTESKQRRYDEHGVRDLGVTEHDVRVMMREAETNGKSGLSQDETGVYLRNEIKAGRITKQQAGKLWWVMLNQVQENTKSYDDWLEGWLKKNS